MKTLELLDYLRRYLNVDQISDYCPNGLQIEGSAEIAHLVTGVTASQALIDEAVSQNADAILVHHGYFWKGEDPCIRGMKKQRIKTLLLNDINLIGYHLPVDVHEEIGNNVQLGSLLGIQNIQPVSGVKPRGVLQYGQLDRPLSAGEFGQRIASTLSRAPLIESPHDGKIELVAWCTGGGQSYIEQAVTLGVDAFVTGEVSEQTIHVAREMGIHFFAAGHHATERYGIKALGEHLAEQFGLPVSFVDIDNPA